MTRSTLELSGLRDKLYWRQVSSSNLLAGGLWHCFKKTEEDGFVSLCGRYSRDLSGGQSIDRPEPHQRCSRCDVEEMNRRGWDESGPTRRAR